MLETIILYTILGLITLFIGINYLPFLRPLKPLITGNNILLTIVIMFLIMLYFYGNLSSFSLGNIFNFIIPSASYQLPLPDEDTLFNDCRDHHIYNELVDFFTFTIINNYQDNCLSNGGHWIYGTNQVSCHTPTIAPAVDCTSPQVLLIERYCEVELESKWVCDNTIRFYGCLCNIDTPTSTFDGTPPEDDTPPEDEQEGYIEGQIGTIFVTSNQWNGAMGGLSGVDEKCQVSAQYSGLSGTWKAIIGDTSINARTRINIDTTFYLLDGTKIADSHADLFDGTIDSNIDLTNNFDYVSGDVWTGSDGAGYYISDHCNNWQWVSENYYGLTGHTIKSDSDWIHNAPEQCAESARLYCVRVS